MTEYSEKPLKTRRSFTKAVIGSLFVILLLLVYGAGTIAFPLLILSRYHAGNCEGVVSLGSWYESAYPNFIRDVSVAEQTRECKSYFLAVSNEEAGDWQAAYDAYRIYAKAYPNGLYAKEAYEHTASMLINLAKDQFAQEHYREALTHLNPVILSFSESEALTDALTLVSSIYTSWGDSLLQTGSFEEAEQVFNEFRAWGQNNREPELETDALNRLVQMYLDWGLAYQSEKQFDLAFSKFDVAAAIEVQVPPNETTQSISAQRKLYVAWGDDLLKQGEFSPAIEKFKQGISKSKGENEDGVEDALINGYIQWARQYSADEDFMGALAQLEVAGREAASDTMKKAVDEVVDETYLAFSQSKGIQAQREMKAALIAVCDKHKKPDLPIFGLNQDSIKFGLYGIDAKLPDELTAQTPGELHYIACVEEGYHTVEKRSQMVILLRVAGGYYYTIVEQYRAELLWNISLRSIDTLDKVAEMTFTGGTPMPFPNTSEGTYFYGSPPDMAEVMEWLQTFIK